MTGNEQLPTSKETSVAPASTADYEGSVSSMDDASANNSPSKDSSKRKKSCKTKVVIGAVVLCIACGLGGFALGSQSSDSTQRTEDYLASIEGKVSYQKDVTAQQSTAQYWINRCAHPDTVLATAKDINAINEATLKADGTKVVDLVALSLTTFDGEEIRADALSQCETWDEIACNGVELNEQEAESYFDDIRQNVRNAKTSANSAYQMGICTTRTEIRSFPTDDFLGSSEDDTYDWAVLDAVLLGEPVLVCFYSEDEQFVYGITQDYEGWINADCIGLCQDRDSWLAAWQFTETSSDFLVVTCGQMAMGLGSGSSYTHQNLFLGTTLKLVPEDEIPATVNGRTPCNDFVVYVPCRDENGDYYSSMALIPQSAQVHVGYLELTQRNIIEVAFGLLGEQYGWGGMDDRLDCSMYVQKIYQCFGLMLPRDTDLQCKMPVDSINLKALSDDDKKKALSSLEPGALLYFSDYAHGVLYLGSVNGYNYVIGDNGFYYEDGEDDGFCNVQGVVVSSLDVCRDDGKTWLSWTGPAIYPWKLA